MKTCAERGIIQRWSSTTGAASYQDQFDTRRLADRIDERLVHDTGSTTTTARSSSGCDMFFLATADAEGRPQCSYKGGEPGFVRVVDEHTIAFPNYDGNGMYLLDGQRAREPARRPAVHRLRASASGCG